MSAALTHRGGYTVWEEGRPLKAAASPESLSHRQDGGPSTRSGGAGILAFPPRSKETAKVLTCSSSGVEGDKEQVIPRLGLLGKGATHTWLFCQGRCTICLLGNVTAVVPPYLWLHFQSSSYRCAQWSKNIKGKIPEINNL